MAENFSHVAEGNNGGIISRLERLKIEVSSFSTHQMLNWLLYQFRGRSDNFDITVWNITIAVEV
jgi:hypothetical protein